MQMETPLIGSGSQEEVDNRVNAIIDLGKSRGYLTYEELNQKLPDEVVSPDKLDSLLMMIDEMGIRLIDETDVAEFTAKPTRASKANIKVSVKKDSKDLKSAPLPEEMAGEEETGKRVQQQTKHEAQERDPVRNLAVAHIVNRGPQHQSQQERLGTGCGKGKAHCYPIVALVPERVAVSLGNYPLTIPGSQPCP